MIARSRTRRATRPVAPAGLGGPGAGPGAALPQTIARLVPLAAGFYAIGLGDDTRGGDMTGGLSIPAVHVCEPPGQPGWLDIGDEHGAAIAWLGARRRTLLVKSGNDAALALVTAFLSADPETAALRLRIQRLDGADDPARELTFEGGDAAAPREIAIDVIAHIRSRGNVRFIDAPWAGRLGPGLWIESFTLLSRQPGVAAALECKGLIQGGEETPWVPGGSACGTQNRAMPLLGFAIRQKPGTLGLRLDCEYSGYFRSGATAGPARNGAPCRSPTDNDPLEGMQLRITQRPMITAPPATRG